MKLAWKLTAVLVAGMGVVLALYAWMRVRHEVGLFERTMRESHQRLGAALAVPLAEVWTLDGEARALGLVDRVNEDRASVRTRWVWLAGEPSDYYRPSAPESALGPVRRGKSAHWIARRDELADVLYTYIPINVPDPRLGALEVAEPMTERARYVRDMVLGVVAATGGVAVLAGLIAMLAGVWLVGRPVDRMVMMARRIGQGELGARLSEGGDDELGMLGREMNAMSDRLAGAGARAEAESTERLRALEQLRHADRLMTVGKLASGIAHELGTPLNVVSGRAKMIGAGELEGEEIRDSAKVIAEQADRMTRIIRQLLDFARPRAPRKEPTDLERLAARTMELLSPLAAKRSVQLSMSDGGGPLPARVDPVQIEQVLANLLVNGMQAMPEGGRLELGLDRSRLVEPDDGRRAGAYVRLWVRDTGVGIPQEDLPHVFEPFFTTKPAGTGTGLGLSVAWGIVREHGGWIEVESSKGMGTTFSIHLPAEEG